MKIATKAMTAVVIALTIALLPDAIEFFQLGLAGFTDASLPSGPFYFIGIAILDWLDRFQVAIMPPNLHLLRIITAHVSVASVHSATELGLVDALNDRPHSTLVELTEVMQRQHCSNAVAGCGAMLPRIHRLLRALETIQIVRSHTHSTIESTTWELTRIGAYLVSTHEHSLAAAALNFGGHQFGYFQHLSETVVRGESAYSIEHGREFWERCHAEPEYGEVFDATMTALAKTGANLAPAQDWDGWRLINMVTELGCGEGTLLEMVLRLHSHISAICFDQPDVAARSRLKWAERSSADGRVSVQSGSFFEESAIPVGADAYLMRQILHDWDDSEAVDILNNTRKAALKRRGEESPAKVIVIERVITEGASLVRSMGNAQADLIMMASFGARGHYGARERTLEEWRELFHKGGWVLTEVLQLRAPFSLLVGSPAVMSY